MATMIDTLKFARSFEQAGFATPQAEALTAAMAEMNREARDDVVKKTDLRGALAELKAELKGEIGGVRRDFAAAGLEAKADLQVGLAQVRIEIATTVSTAKWQILWMMFGSQLFVVIAVVALNNFSKFFN